MKSLVEPKRERDVSKVESKVVGFDYCTVVDHMDLSDLSLQIMD